MKPTRLCSVGALLLLAVLLLTTASQANADKSRGSFQFAFGDVTVVFDAGKAAQDAKELANDLQHSVGEAIGSVDLGSVKEGFEKWITNHASLLQASSTRVAELKAALAVAAAGSPLPDACSKDALAVDMSAPDVKEQVEARVRDCFEAIKKYSEEVHGKLVEEWRRNHPPAVGGEPAVVRSPLIQPRGVVPQSVVESPSVQGMWHTAIQTEPGPERTLTRERSVLPGMWPGKVMEANAQVSAFVGPRPQVWYDEAERPELRIQTPEEDLADMFIDVAELYVDLANSLRVMLRNQRNRRSVETADDFPLIDEPDGDSPDEWFGGEVMEEEVMEEDVVVITVAEGYSFFPNALPEPVDPLRDPPRAHGVVVYHLSTKAALLCFFSFFLGVLAHQHIFSHCDNESASDEEDGCYDDDDAMTKTNAAFEGIVIDV